MWLSFSPAKWVLACRWVRCYCLMFLNKTHVDNCGIYFRRKNIRLCRNWKLQSNPVKTTPVCENFVYNVRYSVVTFVLTITFYSSVRQHSFITTQNIRSLSVAFRGGFGVFNPPPPPKFRSPGKAEPNSQFRRKYIRNNLIRIRVSLIINFFKN
jgi:hypothetical protein